MEALQWGGQGCLLSIRRLLEYRVLKIRIPNMALWSSGMILALGLPKLQEAPRSSRGGAHILAVRQRIDVPFCFAHAPCIDVCILRV